MARPGHVAGTASFSAFARLLGERSPSYVTALKDAGRLVLTDDGKRVIIEASVQRIRDTADPGKIGVVARHAADRQGKAGEGAPVAAGEPPAAAQRDDDVGDEAETAETPDGFQYWRKRNERAKALASERENAIADGQLLDAGEVSAAVAAAAISLRTTFEGLPDVLGPQLAGVNDEAQCRALLAEAIEHALEEASRKFGVLTRQVPAA